MLSNVLSSELTIYGMDLGSSDMFLAEIVKNISLKVYF